MNAMCKSMVTALAIFVMHQCGLDLGVWLKTRKWWCQWLFGKKQGIATINEFDDKSLKKSFSCAEDLARPAPEIWSLWPLLANKATKKR